MRANMRMKVTIVDGKTAVDGVSKALRRIDKRLIDHGERVAFIACSILEKGGLGINEKTLFLLSVFHDVGAYKTEEVDRMLEFETEDVRSHSVYGYLFLKYMTPLSSSAEAILYHHTPWNEIKGSCPECRDYAGLIHLADRADILLGSGAGDEDFEKFAQNTEMKYSDEFMRLLMRCIREDGLEERVRDGTYTDINEKRVEGFSISQEEAFAYIRMIVYSIDFRSEFTVTHTVNTVCFSVYIAKHFGLDDITLEKIYLGAYLHDVGKIAIPYNILEKPDRLTDDEMEIMKRHVTETEQIISGIIPDDISRIACRHHEKLDGTGYPHGIGEAELSFPERIVAVADIVSALSNKRSYKDAYPAELIISILSRMSEKELDRRVCDYVRADYDGIIRGTEAERNDIIRNYTAITGEYRLIMNEHGII